MKYDSDILIIGSGIAGMTAAAYAAESGLSVHVISKGRDIKDSNTYYAQGGIIYRGINEKPADLVKDIIHAGVKIVDREAARVLAWEGPFYINDLLMKKARIKFTKNEAGKLDLTEEAAHSVRRIIHSEDQTGKAIAKGLYKYTSRRKGIKFYNEHMVLDLIQNDKKEILGAYILDIKQKIIKVFIAKATVLATGGAGQIFTHTTNPQSATGDGYAIAARSGVRLVNMEYTQFHPTALNQSESTMFLISEAVRGEGGQLKKANNDYFMKKYHPKASLAPRDIVARAIHKEMLEYQLSFVLLDIHNFLSPKLIKKKFPTIYKTCLKNDIDITRHSIPVVPAFHFMCGGIKVDQWGRTNRKRLFAIGEASCTGIHGANRLASTSLLEGLVWAGRMVKYIVENKSKYEFRENLHLPHLVLPAKGFKPVDPVFFRKDWDNLKNTMWNYVGLVRSNETLKRALKDIKALHETVNDYYKASYNMKEVIELTNAIQTAEIIVRQAIKNKKSLGAHFRSD